MMRRGVIGSAALHLAIILLAYFGLPHIMRPPPEMELPIPVEVVTIADKTTPPKVEPKPEPKPEPPKKVELPPAPPLPEPPQAKPEPTPAPTPPKPEPPQVAQVAPTPVPEPQPKPKPKPVPEKKPEPTPQPVAKPIVPTPPRAKPKPPPDTSLDSILKSVERIKPRSQPDKADKVIKDLAKVAPPITSSVDSKMTISEIDAVRRQIERCWNVPAGAKDAKDLVVDIHVQLNQDGSVRDASVVDQARMSTDSFFRAAAESARRAVYLCSPLKLPPEKYSLWQDMTLSFNPSQIL
jgi:hypothetical protein